MGRGKTKKKTKATEPNVDESSTPSEDAALRAMDGQNVEGWGEEDIRTYNELLMERAKLEKERNELEKKTSRHHTQRALLNENAAHLDTFFKQQPGGDFVYSGYGKCCLDPDFVCTDSQSDTCDHEVCVRAKAKGISWLEMDTVKYYDVRISAEKTERKRNALRKQRDVELIKIKKEEDEEIVAKARRTALIGKKKILGEGGKGADALSDDALLDVLLGSTSLNDTSNTDPKNNAILQAAKENEQYVRKIRGDLDKIRREVNAGKMKPSDARLKLERTHAEMAEAERKNDSFKQMLQGSDSPSAETSPFDLPRTLMKSLLSTNNSNDAFSQAMMVMKQFFSATDPNDVWSAISSLEKTIVKNGQPVSPTLQKSFQTLKDMVGDPKTGAINVDLQTSAGLFNCASVADIMLGLRTKMSDNDPQLLSNPQFKMHGDMFKANRECEEVENAAKVELEKEAKRLRQEPPDVLLAALRKIKSDAVEKSPIPPLSDMILDGHISNIVQANVVGDLLRKAQDGMSESQVAGQLTSIIIAKACNKPERYLDAYESIASSISAMVGERITENLEKAMSKVHTSMTNFVLKHNQKKNGQLTGKEEKAVDSKASSNTVPSASINKQPVQEPADLLELRKHLRAADDPKRHPDDVFRARQAILVYLSKNLQKGIWQAFKEYVQSLRVNRFGFDPAMTVKAKASTYIAQRLSTEPLALLPCITSFFDANHCPAMTMVLIAQQLTTLARREPGKHDASERVLINLCAITEQPPSLSPTWFALFKDLANTAIEIKAIMAIEINASGIPKATALIMAADAMALITTFVLLAIHSVHAESNLSIIKAFFEQSFVNTAVRTTRLEDLDRAYTRFLAFCRSNSHRCTSKGPCTEHLQGLWKDSVPIPEHEVTNVGVRPRSMPIHVKEETSSSSLSKQQKLAEQTAKMQDQLNDWDTKSSSTKTAAPLSYSIIPVKRNVSTEAVPAEKLRSESPSVQSQEESRLGYDVARKALHVAETQLRAYRVAQLQPPESVTQAVHDLTLAVHGDGEEEDDDDDGYCDDEESYCSCEACQEEERAAAASRFVEHLHDDIPQNETLEESRKVAELKVKEIIKGGYNQEYFDHVSQRIKQDALMSRSSDPLEVFNTFEAFFAEIGPMPTALKNAIDAAREETLQVLDERSSKPGTFSEPALAASKDFLSLSKDDMSSSTMINLLLKRHGHQTPTVQAIHDLVANDHEDFESLTLMLIGELYGRQDAIRKIMDSSAELMAAAKKGDLQRHPECLKRYAGLAQEVWFRYNGVSGLNDLRSTKEIKVKNVAVSTPRITETSTQADTSSSSAVEQNEPVVLPTSAATTSSEPQQPTPIRKAQSNGDSTHDAPPSTQPSTQPSTPSKPATTQPPPPSTSTEVLPLTTSEKALQDRLRKVLQSVNDIESTSRQLPDNEHKAGFRRVADQFNIMAVGHVRMAMIIAEANRYRALGRWLERLIAGTERVNGGAVRK